MNSKFGHLNIKDVLHGLIVAIFSAMFPAVINVLSTSTKFSEINWQIILIAGVSGMVGYLGKKFFTNSDDQLMKTDLKPE